MTSLEHGEPRSERGVGAGMIWIVLAGILLGGAYNFLGLQGAQQQRWGLAWIGTDRMAEMSAMPLVSAAGLAAPSALPPVVSDDPLAPPPTAGGGAVLPSIPDVGRPVPIDLSGLKSFHDAGVALIVDAREPDEFAAGHIPGSINLPYDEVITDPVRLESLDPAGRVVIVYCGGGSCEVSISLADEIYHGLGYNQVAVYLGGYPEWVAAGYPVEAGGTEEP